MYSERRNSTSTSVAYFMFIISQLDIEYNSKF
jgi:hypothetical protein